MIKLENVTLVAVSSVKIEETLKALIKSSNNVHFFETIFITDKNFNNNGRITHIKCEPINSLDEYSKFIIYNLHEHIKTDFIVLIQHDGFVVNENSWNNIFFNYDYIGAPWPKDMFIDDDGYNVRVGNGGFSFRSKKILELPTKLKIPFEPYRGYYNEDGLITMANRKLYEQHGIKYATPEVAYKFSREIECEDLDNTIEPFGFHNYRGKNAIYRI